jgi:hypothetical protein
VDGARRGAVSFTGTSPSSQNISFIARTTRPITIKLVNEQAAGSPPIYLDYLGLQHVSTTWRGPTSNQAAPGGDGDGFEVGGANAGANDNIYAIDVDGGRAGSSSCDSRGRDAHDFGGFPISLPEGAPVRGIEVGLYARVDSTAGDPQMCVLLSWDGGSSWTAAKKIGSLSSAEVTYRLGSAGDPWGHSWLYGELGRAKLRVRVVKLSTRLDRDFYLDKVAIRVSY